MRRLFPTLLVLAVLLVACATTGPGGRQSLILIPSSQEVSIGAGMAQQVEQQEKVLADIRWQSYVNEVGQRIVAVCDRRDIDYHFTVIESDQINAFAAPGGFIYVYTGLLKSMEDEGELASVLAHEISHVVARHGIQRLQATLGVAMAYDLVFGGEEANKILEIAINIGMGLAFAEYSRSNERQADQYGVHYLVKTGYDPNAALTMFDKLAAAGDRGTASVFEKLARSHPETQERIADTRQQIAAMGQLPADLTRGRERYQTMLRRLPK